MNTLSLSDLNTSIDAEPRILDVTLGERLGMAQPLNIRKTIRANSAEISLYGGVITHGVKTSCKGGRPSKAFYLNEPQAILLCMFANTPAAADVRHQVITVFMAYRRGSVQVKSHERRTSTPVDQAVRLRTNIDRLEQAVAEMMGPRNSTIATVSEMLRMFEVDEAKHAAMRSMRITAIRKLIHGETERRPVRSGRYGSIVPAMIERGAKRREIMRLTGASSSTVARYRAIVD